MSLSKDAKREIAYLVADAAAQKQAEIGYLVDRVQPGATVGQVNQAIARAVEQDPLSKSWRVVAAIASTIGALLAIPEVQEVIHNAIGEHMPASIAPIAIWMVAAMASLRSKSNDGRMVRNG